MSVTAAGSSSSQVMASMANGAVGMNVLRKSMDQEEQQANQILQAVTQTDPNVGGNVDVRA